jgi:hypothetical protein
MSGFQVIWTSAPDESRVNFRIDRRNVGAGERSIWREELTDFWFKPPSKDPNPKYARDTLWAGFPDWIPLILVLILPVTCVHRWRKVRNRSAAAQCSKCGYDLRATPDRCPECGEIVQKAV